MNPPDQTTVLAYRSLRFFHNILCYISLYKIPFLLDTIYLQAKDHIDNEQDSDNRRMFCGTLSGTQSAIERQDVPKRRTYECRQIF